MKTNLDLFEYNSDVSVQAAYVSSDTTINYSGDLLPTDGIGITVNTEEEGNATYTCDNNIGTQWRSGVTTNAWIAVDFGEGITKQVMKCSILPYTDGTADARVKNFKIQGSNNGIDWQDIFSGQHGENKLKEIFTFSNSNQYRYYRLLILDEWHSQYIGIIEWELMEGEIPIQCYSESVIKTEGSYSLKGVSSTSGLNETLTKDISPIIDLSGLLNIEFDIKTLRIGNNIKVGLHDSGGITTEITPNILSSNTWQRVKINMQNIINSNKDAIDKITITIVNADSNNIFYIDNMFAYYIPNVVIS